MKNHHWFPGTAALLCLLAACGDSSANDDPTTDGADVSADSDADLGPDGAADASGDGVDDTGDVGADADDVELGASGPFAVGYRVDELTYQRPDGGDDRTLRVVVWYPTNDTSGPTPSYFGIFPRPGVFADASVAVDRPSPVMIYSHGHSGYAESSASFVEHFASHGWLVVAPDHTGNTLADNGTQRDTAIYHLRAADLSATLDWLEALRDDDPLAAMRSDLVLGSGHSFGGYTLATVLGAAFDPGQLDACEAETPPGGSFCSTWSPEQRARFEGGLREPRILAGILMAAGNFDLLGADGVAEIETPVLQMTGGMDESVGNETNGDRYWDAFPAGAIRVDMPRGCHQTFGLGCGLPEELDADEGFRIVNTYALAFGLRHLLADARWDAILDGTVEVSGEAVLYRK